jgi:hypothetical protein
VGARIACLREEQDIAQVQVAELLKVWISCSSSPPPSGPF